jgi:hypothetical protein
LNVYDPYERVVKVDVSFYAELNQLLEPTERWWQGEGEARGLILFVQDFQDGDVRKLVFSPQKGTP